MKRLQSTTALPGHAHPLVYSISKFFLVTTYRQSVGLSGSAYLSSCHVLLSPADPYLPAWSISPGGTMFQYVQSADALPGMHNQELPAWHHLDAVLKGLAACLVSSLRRPSCSNSTLCACQWGFNGKCHSLLQRSTHRHKLHRSDVNFASPDCVCAVSRPRC